MTDTERTNIIQGIMLDYPDAFNDTRPVECSNCGDILSACDMMEGPDGRPECHDCHNEKSEEEDYYGHRL